MPTVAFDSVLFDVYADVAEADAYLIASFGSATWFALDANTKAQALVTATRTLDRQCWLGTKSDGSQILDWPRTGTGVSGVEDGIVPADIVNGSIELAFAISGGSNVQDTTTPGSQQLQIIKAGSVMLTYFRGAEGLAAQFSRFPTRVQELVGQYMCGAQGLLGLSGVATGTDGQSVTADPFGFNEGV